MEIVSRYEFANRLKLKKEPYYSLYDELEPSLFGYTLSPVIKVDGGYLDTRVHYYAKSDSDLKTKIEQDATEEPKFVLHSLRYGRGGEVCAVGMKMDDEIRK